MRYLYLFVCALLLSAACKAAEESSTSPVQNIYILRAGEQLQGPLVVTYRVFEWTQSRGRWIFPDVGYFDSGYGKDQVWFAAAGADVLRTRHFDWSQEVYLTQEAGPESTNKRSLWLWPVFDFRFRPRLSGQVAIYPTIPLDRAQKRSLDIDRAKVEWAFKSRWRAGGGYSGGSCGGNSWRHEPFLTVTRKTRLGSFETWLQQTPAGSQVQLRYQFVSGD